MDIKKFKEWRGSEDFKKLTMDSNVILYKNSFHLETDKYPWVWGIWGSRDIPDEWLEDNQKEYGKDEIKRMKVSDILKQDTPEYDYVKKWCLNEMDRRFETLAQVHKRDIEGYNLTSKEKMPYIIFIIDELGLSETYNITLDLNGDSANGSTSDIVIAKNYGFVELYCTSAGNFIIVREKLI